MAVVNSSKFNFRELVNDALGRYETDLITVTTKVIPEVAKEAAKKLRQESPRGPKGYYKGWTSKVEQGRLNVGATVYGKHGTYQLAHLLEHGHANRGGGRTQGIVHIAPVEEWAIKEAYDRIMDEIEGI